jgi:hypothetical protein
MYAKHKPSVAMVVEVSLDIGSFNFAPAFQELLPLVCQYLAAIPRKGQDATPVARSPKDVKPLPFAFPQQPVREDVK